MTVDNLCLHEIRMRVWRQSSETRQAALDEEKQNFLDGSFENMLEAKQSQSLDSPKVSTLDTFNAIRSNLATDVKIQANN